MSAESRMSNKVKLKCTRAELSEVLTGDYMLLARTKGLTRAQAISRHAMRNAMVVILPMIIGEFIGILGGSLIIESIFMIPGIGKKDVDLHVEGRTLTLKTHATWQNPAGFREVETEFLRENYAASLDLPEMADASTLAATLENGILTVTVQKKPETQPRKIAIG